MRKMGIGLGVGINRSNYAQGIFNAYSARVVADGGVVEGGTCVDAVSSLLQSASLLLIPSGYKGGKLYAEIPTNGNGDLTWTRGSDAFRTNASGVIQRVPWNLVRYSEDFTNAFWNKYQSAITANAITAPNGTTTADKLEYTTTGTAVIYATSSALQNQVYTLSCYGKKGTTNIIQIGFTLSGGDKIANFNLNTGVITTTSSGVNASIESVGNGWYRCIMSLTTDINTPNIFINSTSGTTGEYIYIWGAQLVEGTTAQTYLPTTDRLNFPRLSYMYGSCPSALLEPQRTNLLTYSEQFDNSAWLKNNATITANSTTSPDGTTNADTITDNTTVGLHQVQQTISATVGTYTLSCYAKAGTLSYVGLYNNSANAGKFFNLSNGTTASNIVNAPTTATIQSVGNGWYRCTITINTLVASSNWQILVSEDGSAFNYIGTGKNAFIYGAQLEAGAYPTTYIPTTSATATRVADSFSRSNIYTNGLISANGGTWFVEFRNNVAYARDATTRLGIGDTTALTTNSIQFGVSSGGSFRLQIVTFVSGSGATIYTTTTDTTKIAIKWNGTSADIFANGTKVVSATSFTPTNMENFVTNGIGVPFFIQQMALFPTPLTDTQCQTLTT